MIKRLNGKLNLSGLAFWGVILLATSLVSAQSLDVENPYPMKAGINKGTSDSLVGLNYWYFYALPGNSRVTVRMKTPTTLYGAPLNNALTVTLTDAKRTWRVTRMISAQPNRSETTFTADKVPARMKIIVTVAPPNQNLLRMGGDYEIEAAGEVAFDEVKTETADPIIRTFESKVNSYGATRFYADGTLETADGYRGTWKAFDPENRIYTVRIETFVFSVRYRPGYGLVRPGEPNMIVFQELRR